MEKVKLPLIFTSVFLAFHAFSPHIGIPVPVIMASWALSPLVVIWMVIRVLKDGVALQGTFEDSFYEDVESKRVKSRNIE